MKQLHDIPNFSTQTEIRHSPVLTRSNPPPHPPNRWTSRMTCRSPMSKWTNRKSDSAPTNQTIALTSQWRRRVYPQRVASHDRSTLGKKLEKGILFFIWRRPDKARQIADLEKSDMQALCNRRRAAQLIERLLNIRTRLMDPFSSAGRLESKKAGARNQRNAQVYL